MTAKDEKENIIHGLDLGADDYLVKPFAFAELLARIRAVLRRGQTTKDIMKLTVGDLVLNMHDRTAQRQGQTVELTTKEYLLLEYMMRNCGQILTRTMIMENVWGYDFDTGTNVLDVHINRLRKKIDQDFPVKLIHTIIGVGYVIRVDNETA